MKFSKQFAQASTVAFSLALSLASTNALANGSSTTSDSGASTSEDSGFGETGGDPGDFSSAFFISPLPNASFDTAPATLDAEVGVHQGMDDGPISTVEVFVDAESIGSQDCADGCIFADIELAQGVHELMLTADTGYSTSTFVYVDEPLPNDMTDCGDPNPGGEAGGGTGWGSCSVTDDPSSPWGLLGLPLLLLVPGLRRRR
jgi:MYXO-CTERM domain-containing protein